MFIMWQQGGDLTAAALNSDEDFASVRAPVPFGTSAMTGWSPHSELDSSIRSDPFSSLQVGSQSER